MNNLQDIGAERAVIGALFINPAMFAPVSAILRGEPVDIFSDEKHALIYQAIVDVCAHGEAVDIVTTYAQLSKTGALEASGGASYLASLSDAVPTSANAEYYARIVHDLAARRALQDAGRELHIQAENPDTRPETAIEDVASRMAITPGGGPLGDTVAISGLVDDSIDALETGAQGLKTGFDELDDITNGLQAGEMIVLAARPSVGKTALALNIAYNVGVRCGKGVLFFSLEMSATSLMHRLFGIASGSNTHAIRSGFIGDVHLSKIRAVSESLKASSIYLCDSSDITMTDVATISKHYAATHGLALIVVDYLQLMRAGNRAENRQADVADMSRAAKGIARDLNVPLLVLSQFNRAADDGEPRLSQLRESGAIEQDADVALLMSKGEGDVIKVDVAKQRNGPTGRVMLTFDRSSQRFSGVQDGDSYDL